uniref:Uncharacterized protein LOC117365491 n=1 Tax=Geotrypetes seraphini TaxID=260995 RepID=A0A6P8S3L3_GEOSA|nr:uncharacterized protein LOC117365491 [Geotrypetes seraphini]
MGPPVKGYTLDFVNLLWKGNLMGPECSALPVSMLVLHQEEIPLQETSPLLRNQMCSLSDQADQDWEDWRLDSIPLLSQSAVSCLENSGSLSGTRGQDATLLLDQGDDPSVQQLFKLATMPHVITNALGELKLEPQKPSTFQCTIMSRGEPVIRVDRNSIPHFDSVYKKEFQGKVTKPPDPAAKQTISSLVFGDPAHINEVATRQTDYQPYQGKSQKYDRQEALAKMMKSSFSSGDGQNNYSTTTGELYGDYKAEFPPHLGRIYPLTSIPGDRNLETRCNLTSTHRQDYTQMDLKKKELLEDMPWARKKSNLYLGDAKLENHYFKTSHSSDFQPAEPTRVIVSTRSNQESSVPLHFYKQEVPYHPSMEGAQIPEYNASKVICTQVFGAPNPPQDRLSKKPLAPWNTREIYPWLLQCICQLICSILLWECQAISWLNSEKLKRKLGYADLLQIFAI